MPLYPVEFFGLRDIIMVFTSTSETGITSIWAILLSLLLSLIFLNNDESLYVSLCLLFEFVIELL